MRTLKSLSLRYDGLKLSVLDQQQLPQAEGWLDATDPYALIGFIKTLQVRGAPMIGVAAALSLACLARAGATLDEFLQAAKDLRAARPTAVNLMHAIDAMTAAAEVAFTAGAIAEVAESIFDADTELCNAIALQGLAVVKEGEQILTHCNTGALATAGVGTAIGIIRLAFEKNFDVHVYVGETRPLNQGGRLTAWELGTLGVPYTLICDSMAGAIMSQGKVSKVIVGADRIAANGDFANKIGTYSLAVLAYYHRIPFYVAAPFTTVDLGCASGRDIPIEERSPTEVRGALAPVDAPVYNPAFDVTPAELVTGWITDKGVLELKDIKDRALFRLAEVGI